MPTPSSYRRPAFANRPWIAGGLYDLLARSSVLHCDAYVFTYRRAEYLQLEWRSGGTTLIALDTWRIDLDGLMPVWDLHRSEGVLTYNPSAALHARVIRQASEAREGVNGVMRVSLLCHYIDARETDAEAKFTRVTRTHVPKTLPDIL